MGAGRAAHPPGQARRAASDRGRPGGAQRHCLTCSGRGQWKALPKDLPPRSTVWEYLDLWEWDGTLNRIHHALYVEAREQAGREASPTTAIIDSQSAKGALKGGPRLTRPGMTRARRWLAASATS